MRRGKINTLGIMLSIVGEVNKLKSMAEELDYVPSANILSYNPISDNKGELIVNARKAAMPSILNKAHNLGLEVRR